MAKKRPTSLRAVSRRDVIRGSDADEADRADARLKSDPVHRYRDHERRLSNPYGFVCLWLGIEAGVRKARSEATLFDYKRIARLEPEWGQRLDALGATYRELRWVAAVAGDAFVVQREARYNALVELLITSPAPRGRAFEAFMARMPTVDRTLPPLPSPPSTRRA